MPHSLFNSLQSLRLSRGRAAQFYSLPQLEKEGVGPISRLPVSVRIVLESVLRNYDGKRITEANIRALANWKPNAPREDEIPFVVSRILLQDFTGVPLLVDLAAMRSAVARLKQDPKVIEPSVRVDLVIDHSVQVDYFNTVDALRLNMEMEFKRNRPRYEFLKWGQKSFHNFNVIPPGIGICHQVNLEYLAQGVHEKDGICYPDSLVGTDSHTTMINGLGVAGWGVGGIEAEAGMLGQPVYFLTPDVVGVHMTGQLNSGVTATDLVLHITEMLRQAKVVGKFVEFFGEGASRLPVTDRATVGNMSPEYGATMGFFPIDEQSCAYYKATGRGTEHVDLICRYFTAQEMFGMPQPGQVDYTTVLELDLAAVRPSVAGPKRPQDRIDLGSLREKFIDLLQKPGSENGFNKPKDSIARRVAVEIDPSLTSPQSAMRGGGDQRTDLPLTASRGPGANQTSVLTELEMMNNRPTPDQVNSSHRERASVVKTDLGHGDVVIAAITSCTNTLNPSVMLAAGLLAKKAVEKGLTVRQTVKTSLAPGSRVVSHYLEKTGLQPYLNQIGFQLVGYGCTTCIGNSGPLDPKIEDAITKNDLITAGVLSGNRNFEARIHQSVKANFLMSPPLVVAFALAGTVEIDLTRNPLGKGRDGKEVYLRDIWPSLEEVGAAMSASLDPETYRRLYTDFADKNPLWNEIPSAVGDVYQWNPESTYIQEPPFFEHFELTPAAVTPFRGARALAIFGDSVTTDHISPAGSIKATSPAGVYLKERGVEAADFNSYGSRRGNDRVMTRGTFANVRIKNLMLSGVEGGETRHHPEGRQMSIYDAAMQYQSEGVPLMVFAGQEYGTGSSRDWAAKGTRLLGVRAVIAQSFERIHRSNLVQMGVLPCQFPDGMNARTLELKGDETFDLTGFDRELKPRQEVLLNIHRADGKKEEVKLIARLDTPIEVDYYRHGGILPYMLRQLVGASRD